MIRTQISLTEEQHEALREVAAQRGVSMSALIRDAVDEVVLTSRTMRHRRALDALANADFRGGAPDISEKHDEYLYGPSGR